MSNNVTEAMNWLADNAEGTKVLEAVADAGDAIRRQIPTKLSNAEFKYVMEKLWAQRGVEGWDKTSRFDVKADAATSPQLRAIAAPTQISAGLRGRGRGFVILASIPQARF